MLPQYRFTLLKTCPMCGAGIDASNDVGKRLDRSQGLSPEKLKGTETRVSKCGECGFVFPNPLPGPLIKDYEEPLTEANWADRDEVHGKHFEYELQVLQQLSAKPLKDCVALDLGFGRGSSLRTMTSAFKEVHGLEPFRDLFEQAVNRYGPEIRRDLLQEQSIENAEFGKEQFDFIFFEAIQHLPDLERDMIKVVSWLKPGGILYAEVPSSSYLMSSCINFIYRLKRNGFVVNTNPLHGNFSYYEFSKKSFVENGKRLGYEVIRVDDHPCIPPLPSFLKGFFIFLMKMTKTGMQRGVWMRKD